MTIIFIKFASLYYLSYLRIVILINYVVKMEIVRYNASLKEEWDAFVKRAKNSTFLFMRDYMDYHADRFTDVSLMFYDKGELRALLPANFCSEQMAVFSHSGLTYGGFLYSADVKGAEAIAIFEHALLWMKSELGAVCLVYKPIPYIYSLLPAQEDLYALFRVGARLTGRSLSSVVDNACRTNFSELRRRKVAKAAKSGVTYSCSDDFSSYWTILSTVLAGRHSCRPVHSLDEILLLRSRFPENIKLYAAYNEDTMLAGCVVYETANVAHIQYIAASDEGKALAALDGLFNYLFDEVYSGVRFVDFGISTEDGGAVLNEGLLFQKEGFGARGVVYDIYEVEL